MNLQDFLAPVGEEFDADGLLESWRWLVSNRVNPLVVTAFGDLFLVTESGVVLFLDTVAGTCGEVAASVEDWEAKLLHEPALVDEWFMPEFLNELRAAQKHLAHGQCYSTRQSLKLGGAFAVENWDPTNWEVHFCFAGELHKALKDVPPGTRITGVKGPRF